MKITMHFERLIDAAVVLSLADLVLGSRGLAATGLDPRAVLPPLAALVAVPVVFVVALRVVPRQTIALVLRIFVVRCGGESQGARGGVDRKQAVVGAAGEEAPHTPQEAMHADDIPRIPWL